MVEQAPTDPDLALHDDTNAFSSTVTPDTSEFMTRDETPKNRLSKSAWWPSSASFKLFARHCFRHRWRQRDEARVWQLGRHLLFWSCECDGCGIRLRQLSFETWVRCICLRGGSWASKSMDLWCGRTQDEPKQREYYDLIRTELTQCSCHKCSYIFCTAPVDDSETYLECTSSTNNFDGLKPDDSIQLMSALSFQ